MTRSLGFFSLLVSATISIFAATDLPRSDSDESLEIEPPLLIPNLDRKLEKPQSTNEASATPAPIIDPEKLEKDLARAKKNAAGAERLFKIGVIAKVEAEFRGLRVVRLQSDLENARLALAKEALQKNETRLAAGEISKEDMGETEAALAHAIEAAHAAAAGRERAELDFAEANLHRQQKLLALGSGHKSDVNRAEQKLAELKAPKE